MRILLCKKSLDRAGVLVSLPDALREREHTPIVPDCLQRCIKCDEGNLVALADGAPLSVKSEAELLAAIDELAADE
jgi:hypothetical protein